ncbi:MAG: hypothetical protein B7Y45_08290 [Sphingomonas sp. 28-66-16]|nr:MAG: hypothetical protein B7Y45_08290 [Sphingomonas sp. 28-66-16]
MIALFGVALFAVALAAVFAVFATTLIPALPRIAALLRDGAVPMVDEHPIAIAAHRGRPRRIVKRTAPFQRVSRVAA